MTLHDHLIGILCKYMGRSSSQYVTTLLGIVDIDLVIMEIYCFWFVTWPHLGTYFKRDMWIYGWKPYTKSHPISMFSGHWSSTNGDIKYLICHVTSHNNVIEKSCNFLSGNCSWYVTTLPILVVIGIYCGSKDIIFLVCHMIYQKYVTKESGEYINRSPSR